MSTATLTSETTLEITGKTYTVISSTNAQTRIQSQADDKVYDIEVCGERLECNCADFVNRRKGLPGQSACKHIQAVVDAGLMAQPIFRPEIPAPGLVEFNTKELKTALGILGKVAPKPNRCPKPILCNALFTTNTEGVPCLEATNLDCSVRFKLTSNGQEYNGAALVPVHKVADLLKSHKGDTSSLDLQHGSIRVNKSVAIEAPSDRDTRIFLADEFPRMPRFNPSEHFQMKASDFVRAIERTAFACDVESTRFALGNIALDFGVNGNMVEFVATDGRRLVTQSVDIWRVTPEHAGDPAQNTDFHPNHFPMLPVHFARVVADAAKKAERGAILNIAFTGRAEGEKSSPAIMIEIENVGEFYTREVGGTFPSGYRDVIPCHIDTHVDMEASYLLPILATLSKVITDESKGTKFLFFVGQEDMPAALAISYGKLENPTYAAEIPLNYAVAGKHVAVTLDPTYLSDAFKALGKNPGRIKIGLTDHKNPLRIANDSGWVYVAMPMTRAGRDGSKDATEHLRHFLKSREQANTPAVVVEEPTPVEPPVIVDTPAVEVTPEPIAAIQADPEPIPTVDSLPRGKAPEPHGEVFGVHFLEAFIVLFCPACDVDMIQTYDCNPPEVYQDSECDVMLDILDDEWTLVYPNPDPAPEPDKTQTLEPKTQALESSKPLHPFEKAGLGKAPFRFAGMVEQDVQTNGQRIIGTTANGCAIETKPGGTCDACGMAIIDMYRIVSSDGIKSKVGCDCILKLDPKENPRLVSDVKSAKAKLTAKKREATKERERERIAKAFALIEIASNAAILDALPHPSRPDCGGSLLTYVRWMSSNAGHTGRLKAAIMIEKALETTTPTPDPEPSPVEDGDKTQASEFVPKTQALESPTATKGDPVTLYINGMFGMKKVEGKLIGFGTSAYAQYKESPFIDLIPKGKRKGVQYRQSFQPMMVLLSGHGHPDASNWLTPEQVNGNGVVISESRHSSCSPEWTYEMNRFINAYVASKPGITVVDFRYTKAESDPDSAQA